MIAYVLNPVKVDPDYPSTPKPSTSENEMDNRRRYIGGFRIASPVLSISWQYPTGFAYLLRRYFFGDIFKINAVPGNILIYPKAEKFLPKGGKTMQNIKLDLNPGVAYKEAEKAAKEAAAAQSSAGLSLLAWYDKQRQMGAPQEACSLENWKCVLDYAEHHNADIKVSVNNDSFEFFFAKTPAGTETLDKEGVADVHKGIAVDQDENVQGG